ncbi:neomenthol dehydrogenase [Vigna unguiculata]|uniref:Neomenthol dehydrogenase n=1 Tax=Vigna unguiculata TaxID=3917 RepID=A0A4D6NB09_VIGUN|nr:neomenthol dehydrogenase [Vigna unguiculata]
MTQADIFNRQYTGWNTSALQVLEKLFPKTLLTCIPLQKARVLSHVLISCPLLLVILLSWIVEGFPVSPHLRYWILVLGLVQLSGIIFLNFVMVNVSFPKESWARGVLSDVDNLTEEKVDEIVKKFLSDFKEGSLESKGWPRYLGAYIVSKTALC